jgi:phospholipase/carboxylesterase
MKLQTRSAQIGELSCRVVEAAGNQARPDVVVVICHGFGAPGDDLVPVGGELAELLGSDAARVRFIFPAAPLGLDRYGIPGGRAWWPIDMLKLQAAVEQGEFRDLRRDCPEMLPDARRLLMTLLEEIRAGTGLPLSRFVLGGFSQGSMLATDVALHLPESPGALVVWSGTLLCEDQWSLLAPLRAGLRVVQSHGHEDPILPFTAAEWLRDLLAQSGLDVQFLSFHGFHQIPFAAQQAAAAVIKRIVAGI